MGTLAVYMLVEEEEEKAVFALSSPTRRRFDEAGSTNPRPGTPTGKGKTSIQLLKSSISKPIPQPSMAHTPRPRPTTSHMRTRTTRLLAIRTHTIRSVLYQEAQVLCSTHSPSQPEDKRT